MTDHKTSPNYTELLAYEGSFAAASPVSDGIGKNQDASTTHATADGYASDISGDGGEGAAIQLDEVRASETGTAFTRDPRSWAHRGSHGHHHGSQHVSQAVKTKRQEVSLFIGPPPPQVSNYAGTAQCLVLVGGLPWWLTDANLRRYTEQFGQLRCIRILDFERSGKSAGIALLEYARPEGARNAADPKEGLCQLAVWESLGVPAPQLVLVSSELFSKLRSGVLPWPDGGPCSDELRAIMMRQFDQSHNKQRQSGDSPARARRRTLTTAGSNTSLGSGRTGSPESDRPGREEAWADKLRALKGNVNNRQEIQTFAAPPGSVDASRKKRRR